MKIALDVVLAVCVFGWGVVLNYCSRYDKVISWAIGYVAPANLTKQELNTYRAALAPRSYLRAINYQFGLPLVILILGTLIDWYLGVLGVIISVVVVYGVLSVLAAGTIEKYLYQIIMSLQHKAADYKKAGDEEREEAAEDFLVPLKIVYAKVLGKNYRVPSSGSINLEVEVPHAATLRRS